MVGTGEVGELLCLDVDVHARGFDCLLVVNQCGVDVGGPQNLVFVQVFFILLPDSSHLWFDDGWSVVLGVLVGYS